MRDPSIALVFAWLAIGIGIGDILKEGTSVLARRVGRVIKLGTPITVGVFLIIETVHPDYFVQPHVLDTMLGACYLAVGLLDHWGALLPVSDDDSPNPGGSPE